MKIDYLSTILKKNHALNDYIITGNFWQLKNCLFEIALLIKN